MQALNQYALLHHFSDRKIQSIQSIARTHALLVKHNNTPPMSTIKIDLDDVTFACQLQIFDRTNWWEIGRTSTWRTFPADESNDLEP